MRKLLSVAIGLVSLITVFILSLGSAQEISINPALLSDIEALITETLDEYEVPGFAINISLDGELVYSKGFGVRKLGGDAKVDSQTVFQMHSISKTITATAIMQLVEQGKIDLDAPVTEYLPYFQLDDVRYETITVRHLLTHTSGLGGLYENYANFNEGWELIIPEFGEDSLERYVRGLTDSPLHFGPGESWSYSDVGFNVLADIVAQVTGLNVEMYAQQNIFTPLGLMNTTFLLDEVNQDHFASPHVRDDRGKVVVSEVIPYHRPFAGCMNLYSTVEDLTQWALANMNHAELDGTRFLTLASHDLLWATQAETGIDWWFIQGYGFGWFVTELRGHRIIWHGGADLGYNTQVYLAPDDEIAIVAAGNYFDSTEELPSYADNLAIAIMNMILGIEE